MFSELMLLRIPVILLAITVHEFAHGYVALLRGDATARDAGRLTLNPIPHLDVFGALMMLFGPFGWAKPVPVNPYNLRRPRSDMVLVSVAGPAANIVCGCLFGLILRVLHDTGAGIADSRHVAALLQLGFLLNIGLAFFNLIPVPPLDGSKIVMGFLPPAQVNAYLRYTRHVPTVFLVLLLAEWALRIRIFSVVFDPLFGPFLRFFQFIVFGAGG